jgi:hypothetical protein
MTLDVDTPAPPELAAVDPDQYDDTEVTATADYRREELSSFLQDGAWAEAFETWAADAEVTADEWAIVEDLGLVERFDFFWDDYANRVGYHAPGIPQDWKERTVHSDLTSWGQVSSINAGLTELGQVVSETLKEGYIDWESEFEAPDDLPDFE